MNATDAKLNVTLPNGYNGLPIEVVLREGEAPEALDPKEPNIIVITGTIDSPLRWIRQRSFDPKESNILVDRDNINIVLTIEEKNFYKTTITGQLDLANKFREFGINFPKTWDPQKLSQFLKMNRAFFSDKTVNMTLVSDLKNFKAKIRQDVEQNQQENGSKTDNFSQIVDSNLPKSFKVNIPIFKGFPPVEIEIEIYADVDGRDVSLTLISPGAAELLEDYRNKVIDEQISEIQKIAPEIVIIEK